MATFKVGQRVRIIGVPVVKEPMGCLGREATIAGSLKKWKTEDCGVVLAYSLCIDGLGYNTPSGLPWVAEPWQLAPLTDPRASEFIADMERFAHVAKTTKVTA